MWPPRPRTLGQRPAPDAAPRAELNTGALRASCSVVQVGVQRRQRAPNRGADGALARLGPSPPGRTSAAVGPGAAGLRGRRFARGPAPRGARSRGSAAELRDWLGLPEEGGLAGCGRLPSNRVIRRDPIRTRLRASCPASPNDRAGAGEGREARRSHYPCGRRAWNPRC